MTLFPALARHPGMAVLLVSCCQKLFSPDRLASAVTRILGVPAAA